jgi:hypothetical protein
MQNPSQKVNPLIGLMRQPKLYIKLPSQGQYWKEGSLKLSANGEYPVYSMTARDEMLIKTPDALLNGQAVVSLLESCLPNITDGWECPQLDLDTILIAIRIATYGETMDTTVKVKELEGTYEINLKNLLDSLVSTISWNNRIELDRNTVVYVRPLTYRNVSRLGIDSFEMQRIINLVNDDTVDEKEKVELFKVHFKRLTQLNLDIIADSIYKVDTSAGSVTDVEFIKEFIYNCDKDVFNKIKSHIDAIQDANSIKPIKVKATEEMISAGSDEEIEAPIFFDPSSFFV